MKNFRPAPYLLLSVFLSSSVLAEPDVSDYLVDRYAEISLKFDQDSDLEEPLRQLLRMAEQHRDASPDDAGAWIACARVRFGYANTQGPIKGMRLMKQARDEMEAAIAIDPLAGAGFPQAFLGYLYAGMPSWPISFGSSRTSDEYFEKARSINSESIEFKYFIAIVSASNGDIDVAVSHLNAATDMVTKNAATSPTMRLYEKHILELLQQLE